MNSDLRRRLKENQLTIGSWLTIGNVTVLEVMMDSGFDWIVLDLEHSMMDMSDISNLLAVANARDFPILVRLTSNDANQAKRVMDAGATGIVVPMIKTGDDIHRAVRSVKYAPIGDRGVGLFRAQGYGASFYEYVRKVNSDSVVVGQIEHIDAVKNIESILSEKDLDATIVGPYDLSGSLGIPGRMDDPAMKQALEAYEMMSDNKKVTRGYHVVYPHAEEVVAKYNRGYRLIAFSVDFLLLGSAGVGGLDSVRKALQ